MELRMNELSQSIPPSVEDVKYTVEAVLTPDELYYYIPITVGLLREQVFRLQLASDLPFIYLLDKHYCNRKPASQDLNCFDSSVNFDSCNSCSSRFCIRLGQSFVTLLPNSTKSRYYVCLVLYETFLRVGTWNGFDGFLGLTFSLDYFATPFSRLFPSTWKNVLVFEFHPKGQKSYFHIGGHPNVTDISWSETQSEGASIDFHPAEAEQLKENVHNFPLFHLSICGNSLFDITSSHYAARISTTMEGIFLPEPMFKLLITYFPVDCRANLDVQFPCKILGSFANLPSLSFRLSESGEELMIPISSLILHSQNQTLALGMRTVGTKIVLGTLAMRSFLVVVDNDERRIGFKANVKSVSQEERNANCRERKTCKVDEQYDEGNNICYSTSCHYYYFQEFNENTKSCQLVIGWRVASIVLLVVLAALEFLISELYIKSTRKVMEATPNLNQI